MAPRCAAQVVAGASFASRRRRRYPPFARRSQPAGRACSTSASKPTDSAFMPLDNAAIARVLSEIGDLMELKGENPFKIRAYRSGADVVAGSPEQVAGLTAVQ